MKKFAMALMGTAVALAMPMAAHAQSFSTVDSSGSVSGSGSANLEQSVNVTCDVGLSGSVSASTISITSRSVSPGDFLCIAVVPYGTWSAAVVSGDATKIDVTMGANTVANQPCYGTVRGDWDNVGKILSITSKTLPPVNPAHDTCTIHQADIYIPNLNL
ncbi:hypothetical protein ACIPPQ_16630 [Sphingopyxis sp. LARHCG72]|jgi:hypothetical protein